MPARSTAGARADAPNADEFSGQTVTAHLEYSNRRLRRFRGRNIVLRLRNRLVRWSGLSKWLRGRKVVLRLRNGLLKRRGRSRRLRIILAGNGNRVIEILCIEPLQRAHAFLHAVFP